MPTEACAASGQMDSRQVASHVEAGEMRSGELEAAPLSAYSPDDRAFFRFWYGHMQGDLMQPPLAGIDHSTARYIWNAARTAAAPLPTYHQQEKL